MLSQIRQRIQSHEAKEILHHGLIGGVVAVILVAVDLLQHGVLSKHPWWLAIAALPVAFAIAFLSLALFERYARLKVPLRLDGIEDTVDGVWVYKTMDVGGDKWNRGSVTTITSSGWGFRLEGHSYSQVDLKIPAGHFRGQGYLWEDDKVSFRYRGFESNDRSSGLTHDLGVGYYQFYRVDNKLFIRGAFTGFLGPEQRMISRRLEGFRVSPKIDETAEKAATERLPELLADAAADAGFGGTWIDAIYERSDQNTASPRPNASATAKWQLIQGSIIEIEPNESDSKSFTVRGRTFDRGAIENRQTSQVTRKLPFQGEARLSVYPGQFPVLYYAFQGYEDTGGHGVARYELHQGEGADTFVGEFSRGQQRPLRIVFGKKIREKAFDRQVELLREHLEKCIKFPPAKFLTL